MDTGSVAGMTSQRIWNIAPDLIRGPVSRAIENTYRQTGIIAGGAGQGGL